MLWWFRAPYGILLKLFTCLPSFFLFFSIEYVYVIIERLKSIEL